MQCCPSSCSVIRPSCSVLRSRAALSELLQCYPSSCSAIRVRPVLSEFVQRYPSSCSVVRAHAVRSELAQCDPSNVGLVKPNGNSMPNIKTVYRYVRKKRLVAIVRRLPIPPTPDLNVEASWPKRSGFEVRNKRLVYVRAVVALKRLFNIEIGWPVGITCHTGSPTGRFFCTHRTQLVQW